MDHEDNLDLRVRQLAKKHAETRWLALRVDEDVKVLHYELREVKATQAVHTAILEGHSARFDLVDAQLREHSARFDSIDEQLQAHDGRFDSLESQIQSLTQMVGAVLERVPQEPPKNPDQN